MSLPKLLKAEQLTDPLGMDLPAVYELLKTLPSGVVVRFGRRLRVNEDAFKDWLAAGGTV